MNVYDFDNTIYDGESAFDFFVFCLKKHPSLIRLFPLLVVKFIRYKLLLISYDELERNIKKYAMDFIIKVGDIEKLAEQFWDKYICRIKKFYFDIKSNNDLIMSATAGFLLEKLSPRIGGLNYIASEIDINTGEIKRICFRENKVEIFKSFFPDTEIENFYTDSLNDKPMIEIAKNAYMVKGKKVRKIK